MLKVGVTGGIGSGKSTVCRVFHTLGIPVFDADQAAREVMEQDPQLIAAIKKLFDPDIYIQGKLDRQRVAQAVFTDNSLLQSLNKLVHPVTTAFARDWHNRQHTPYTIKEAAIFFESGTDAEMDIMIGVFAPVEIRIERAMLRSGLSRAEVGARIARQMDEGEKMSRCRFVIINDDSTAVLPQVLNIHQRLCTQA